MAPASLVCLKANWGSIIAGTGSGPEGSRPTAGNCRLQVYGDENAVGSTGLGCCWQPLAARFLIRNYINSFFEISPNTTGNGITRMRFGG